MVMLGPFLIEGNLNGNSILRLLDRQIIPQLAEHFEIQQEQFRHLWWAQDGAPSNRLLGVRSRLIQALGNKVIALNHDVEWLPRSPDLTARHFVLWGYINNKVFLTPPKYSRAKGLNHK